MKVQVHCVKWPHGSLNKYKAKGLRRGPSSLFLSSLSNEDVWNPLSCAPARVILRLRGIGDKNESVLPFFSYFAKQLSDWNIT